MLASQVVRIDNHEKSGKMPDILPNTYILMYKKKSTAAKNKLVIAQTHESATRKHLLESRSRKMYKEQLNPNI